MIRRPRRSILLHVQHYRGVGHRVRMSRIARALDEGFSVVMLDGGPPDPPPDIPETVRWVPLEPLFADLPRPVPSQPTHGHRSPFGEIRPLNPALRLDEALALRRRSVVEAVAAVRPDAFLIEYYPFDRILLTAEIEDGISSLRNLNPDALVLSSIRDVAVADIEPIDVVRRRVIAAAPRFDAVLLHNDPTVLQVREEHRWLDGIGIPVIETGFVAPFGTRVARQERHGIVVSMGGGIDGLPLVEAVLAVWDDLRRRDLPEAFRSIEIYDGPYLPDAHRHRIASLCSARGVPWLPFSRGFVQRLWTAALSISRAGYNTCIELLASGTPAILSPTRAIRNDQPQRAFALDARRRAIVAQDTRESMLTAIERGLTFTPVLDQLRLAGAETTARWIGEMVERRAHGQQRRP